MPRTIQEIAQDPEFKNWGSSERAEFISAYFDKNYKDRFDTEDEAKSFRSALLKKYAGEPTRLPSQLQDLGKMVTLAPPTTEEKPLTFKERLAYVPARFGAAIERPAYAVTELAMKAGKTAAEYPRIGQENWLSRQFRKGEEYYAQPEKHGYITPKAVELQARTRKEAYKQGTVQGIVQDVSEAGFDVGALIGQFAAMGTLGHSAPTGVLGKVSPLRGLATRIVKIGTHRFATTTGAYKDRLQAAIVGIGYNITPYIAQATGATGLSSIAIDAALNTFLTSPTYAKALKEAGGLNVDFLSMAIPQFAMDVGMAMSTRGLPENQRKAAVRKYTKHRIKELPKLPEQEAQKLMTKLETTLKDIKPTAEPKPKVTPTLKPTTTPKTPPTKTKPITWQSQLDITTLNKQMHKEFAAEAKAEVQPSVSKPEVTPTLKTTIKQPSVSRALHKHHARIVGEQKVEGQSSVKILSTHRGVKTTVYIPKDKFDAEHLEKTLGGLQRKHDYSEDVFKGLDRETQNKLRESDSYNEAEIRALSRAKETEVPAQERILGDYNFYMAFGPPISTKDLVKTGKRFWGAAKTLARPPQDAGLRDVALCVDTFVGDMNKGRLLGKWDQGDVEALVPKVKHRAAIFRYMYDPIKYGKLLSADERAVARVLQDEFAKIKTEAEKNGISVGFRENYVPQLYKDHPARIRRVLGSRFPRTKPFFAFPRKYENPDVAKTAGLTPVEDVALLLGAYRESFMRALAAKKFVGGLKMLTTKDGLPVLMGKPRDKAKLKVYEYEYQFVNVRALQRFMKVGETEGKEFFVKSDVKASPEIAKTLNNLFAPQVSPNRFITAYKLARSKVKRIVMVNPLIHGTNIFSDALDETNSAIQLLNFPRAATRTLGVYKRGAQLYKERNPMVVRAVESGLNLTDRYHNELREGLTGGTKLTTLFDPVKPILYPFQKLEKWSDRVLFQTMIRDVQIGLFELLTNRWQKANLSMAQVDVDRAAASYENTLLGTLPSHWMSRFARESGATACFARNWTFSNIDMVVKGITSGHRGMGMKGLTPEQQKLVGHHFVKHLGRGMFALMLYTNMMQYAMLAATNEFKKRGWMKGPRVPLHTSFQNESGHWIDIDTGYRNNRGQPIYLVGPFFRYLRDHIGWASDPLKTAYNKGEPLLKNTLEQMANYSVWRQKNIKKRGAPTWDNTKERAEYFVKSITPSMFWAMAPGGGYEPTTLETIVPFLGMWIRRGAPGGKYTQKLFEYQAEKGYKKSKVDEQINSLLMKGMFDEAIRLMVGSGRYTRTEDMQNRILRFVAPLNYYQRIRTGRKEWGGFLATLSPEERKELFGEMKDELLTVAKRED